jgi:hypothetical protein
MTRKSSSRLGLQRPTLSVVSWLFVACGARSALDLAPEDTAVTTPPPDSGMADIAPPSDGRSDDSDDATDTVPDETGPTDSCVGLPVPRQIAPLSTATVTTQSPTLHWSLPTGWDGAQVDLCQDRTCSVVPGTIQTSGQGHTTSLTVPGLSAGIHYWRIRGLKLSAHGAVVGCQTSPVWEFVVGARSAPVDSSWGTFLDADENGFADVAVGAFGKYQVYLTAAAFVYPGGPSFPTGSAFTASVPGVYNTNYTPAVASAGDVNGDGYADFLLGAGSDALFGGSGSASVYLGGPSGLTSTPIALGNPNAERSFGLTVSSAGDVNGDGYADVLVGSGYTSSYGGTVYLYLGGASGPSTTPITLSNPRSTGAFGDVVASAGDVNGDGFADVVIGGFNNNDPTEGAYLYLGGPGGLSTPPTSLKTSATQLGWLVSGAGDVNGDGYADVIAGAEYSSTVSVYLGGPAGLSTMPGSIILPNMESPRNLASVRDVNGDGYGDIIIANGKAYLFFGGPNGPNSPVLLTNPSDAGGYTGFAISVAGAGDVNGDGFDDIVVGSNGTGGEVGSAILFWGSASGPTATPTSVLGPGGMFTYFGQSVARVPRTRAGVPHRAR